MSIKRNTLYNLAGTVAPSLVSILIVPLYLHKIGEDRYGVLTIVWLFLGYFGVFDFGLSRATANIFARLRGAPPAEREAVFWTSLSLNAFFGALGGVSVYFIGKIVLAHFFKIPDVLRPEVLSSIPWLAATIPLSIISGMLSGVLEGGERFLSINTINFFANLGFQLIPLSIAYLVSPKLTIVLPAAVISRLILLVLPILALLVREVPIHGNMRFSAKWARELFQYGGWVSINGIISPLFSSADRFIIGSILGAAEVSIYTVPYNLVHRFQILPAALSRSLFPRFSGLPKAEGDQLAAQATRTLATLTAPFFVVAVIFMHPFLSLWIDPVFADRGSLVGEVLSLGVWMSSMAFIAFSLLQGQGNVRAVALVHLYETPFLLAITWCGIHWAGLTGAAWALSVRDIADALIFLALAHLLRASAWRLTISAAWIVVAIFAIQFVPGTLIARSALALVLVVGSLAWAWSVEPTFRLYLKKFLLLIHAPNLLIRWSDS